MFTKDRLQSKLTPLSTQTILRTMWESSQRFRKKIMRHTGKINSWKARIGILVTEKKIIVDIGGSIQTQFVVKKE